MLVLSVWLGAYSLIRIGFRADSGWGVVLIGFRVASLAVGVQADRACTISPVGERAAQLPPVSLARLKAPSSMGRTVSLGLGA